MPQIGHDSGAAARYAASAPIRRGAPDGTPWPLGQQLQGLVQACVDRPGGCAALRAAVLALGGETRSVLDAVAVLDRICCAVHPADPAATGSADD
ncbi:hypothetical protein SGLAM104S_01226 [Streptomyces glaucescens]